MTPTWHGRRGAVVLGPTQHRVARWLADRTKRGRVLIRTADLADALHIERSEAYRITARLRVLGLFGIENDRAGSRRGRRYWRTAVEHDTSVGLDPARHRSAWSRVVGWTRMRGQHAADRLAAIRSSHYIPAAAVPSPSDGTAEHSPAANVGTDAAGESFADRMRRAGLGLLMDGWGVA